MTRIDHSFSDANKLNGKFVKAIRRQITSAEGFPLPGSPQAIVHRDNEGGSVEWVSFRSSSLVLDSRVGGIYHPFVLQPNAYNFDPASLGFPAALVASLPVKTFPGIFLADGYSSLISGASNYTGSGQFSESTQFSASELVSKSLQKHILRTGFEYQVLRYNLNSPSSSLGTFSFNRAFTQKNTVNGDAASGNTLASFLLGYPANIAPSSGNNPPISQATINKSNAFQQLYYALFVQDDWRVTNKLTLNMGLRWDYESPLSERNNQQNAGFCFTCASPLQAPGLNLTGGLQFVSSNNRYPYRKEFNNFQPRFGLAYQITPALVFHAGAGIMYVQTIDTAGSQGFSQPTAYVATTDNKTPANSLSNPYPNGLIQPSGNAGGLSTLLGQGISFTDPRREVPRLYQYSTNFQDQLPGGMVLEIGFVGNLARKLEVSKGIDALPTQYLALGAAALQKQVANPFAGRLPGSSLNGATIQQQFLLTPFPQFTSITENNISKGSVGKRLLHGYARPAHQTFLAWIYCEC